MVTKFLGINDASKAYQEAGSPITPHFIRQLALSGKIHAVRVGKGKIIVNMDSLDNYLSGSKLTDEQPTQTADSGGIRPVPLRIGR